MPVQEPVQFLMNESGAIFVVEMYLPRPVEKITASKTIFRLRH